MRLCILTTLVILITLSIYAQQNSPDLFREDMIVTASALSEEVEDSPASVTVISRRDIEQKNAIDLEEVLRDVPGLFLSRSGSAGRQTSLFTRGVNSAQTLVLWNGIEINNPYFSGYDWGQFSTIGVEKVEVVRGPFSALYGADAVGGVVNVITGANRPGLHADVLVGQSGLLNGRAELTAVRSDLSADLAVEAREDDGFHNNDDFGQFALLASFRWNASDRIIVGGSGRFNDYELGIPFNSGAPSPERRQEGGELQLALPVTVSFDALTWELTLSRTEHAIDFRDPLDAFGPIASETDSEIDRLATSVRLEGPLGTIVAGGEIEDSSVTDESLFGTNLDDHRRKSRSLFVENRYSGSVAGGALEVAAGVRYDDFDQFGSESSPRIGAGWRWGGIRGRLAYGEAFRAPSIGDLFFPFFGNPDLDPEKTRSLEAGVDWSSRAATVSATWFHNEIMDLIVFDPTTGLAGNLGEATTKGIEIGGSARARNVRISGAWTFLDTEDRATGNPLLRRPEQSGSLSIAWQKNAFGALIRAIHAGRRDDFQPAFPFGRVANGSYTVVGLDLRYEAGPGLTPYVRIENLLDEEYQEVLGYPAPPRRAAIGLRYSR